jgi:hypothetical protein
MPLSATAERALRAYGGAEVWSNAQRVEADVTLSGLLFLIKRRISPPHARITTEVQTPHSTITPVDRDGNTGVLNGFTVSLHSPGGQVMTTRDDASRRDELRHIWHAWDTLDLMYFLGYAFWNYFSLPYALMRDDVDWREVREGVLEARFPPDLPVHSRVQRFYFDRNGLLMRNDYWPEFTASRGRVWVANIVLAHKDSNGIPYPSLRRVSPTRGQFGPPAKIVKMVGIEVHNWHLLSAAP